MQGVFAVYNPDGVNLHYIGYSPRKYSDLAIIMHINPLNEHYNAQFDENIVESTILLQDPDMDQFSAWLESSPKDPQTDHNSHCNGKYSFQFRPQRQK